MTRHDNREPTVAGTATGATPNNTPTTPAEPPHKHNRFIEELGEGRVAAAFGERIDIILRVLLMAAVAIGCFLVLKPFLTAILIAAVIAVVSWPLFERLLATMRHARTLAATTMVVLIVVGFLLPLTFLLVALAQQIPRFVSRVGEWLRDPTPVLEAVRNIPYAGEWLHEEFVVAIDPTTFGHTVQKILDPLSSWLLNTAVNFSNGVLQLVLVTFIVFFFYRDGVWFAERIAMLVKRLSGGISSEITGILVNTTRSVVFGIAGTAIGQGLVAGVGFWLAGVPGVIVLSFAVCVLSVIPIGPPLIWGPAAVWLYSQGEAGQAFFLVLWGTLAVSSVDNFLKPILISRGTSMPIALIFLGVFGGVLAFGFLGLILGPLLLAVGIALFKAWLRRPVIRFAQQAAKTNNRSARKRIRSGANSIQRNAQKNASAQEKRSGNVANRNS